MQTLNLRKLNTRQRQRVSSIDLLINQQMPADRKAYSK
jgi:hypothetical protein